MKNQIKSYYGKNKDKIATEILAILKDLVRAKTVNFQRDQLSNFSYMTQPGDESRAVQIVSRELDKIGIKYEIKEHEKGRANLLGYFGEGKTSLLVAAHTDVVPPADGWSVEPFDTTIKDGKVYGRGTIDNKGPLASTIIALKIMKELGVKLKGQFILGAVASEEFRQPKEMDPGIEFLIKNKYLTPTYAIIPDIGMNMKNIDVAEKGRLQLKVTSHGKQAHGSTPERGVNALTMMAKFLMKLESYELKYKPHQYLIKPSINAGIIHGGTVSNIVPAVCELTLDIRYLPSQSAEGIVQELKALGESIANTKFSFDIINCTIAHEVNPDNILVKALQANTKDILGHSAEPFGMGGGTFAKSFNLGGITAVGFGPGDDTAFHIADEYIEIKQLVEFAEIISVTAIDILGC